MPADPIPRLNDALSGRYRIERELGEGGMATVYLADDLKHRRKVAIKVLKPELAAVVGGERFLAEIRTTANLQHPHILPLFDSGESNSFLYFVMPYVEGETLRDRIARERELPVEDAVTLARKVASALDYAHRQGVIHRDVKPENILLHEAEPLVADFGIALAVQQAGGGRLTETGLSLGTPAYMAPEQAGGDREPDVRSDVYGLGCVLYEMLAGRPPYVGNSAQQILAKVLTQEPPPLTGERKQVPPHVAAAVGTALQRIPADRFGSARAFGEALDDPTFRGLAHEWHDDRSRRRGLGGLVLTGAVGLAAGLLVGGLVAGGADEPLPVFRQLTHTGTVGCAAISPDGTEVALIQSYGEETSCRGSLVVRALPAGAPVVLLDSVDGGNELSWSPDGSSLLLRASVQGREGQYLVPVGGGAPRRLGPPLEFATFKTADSVVVLFGTEVRVLDPRSGAELRRDTLARSVMFADWSEEAGAWVTAYYTPGRPLGVAGVLSLMDEDFRPTDSLPGYPIEVAWAGPDRVIFHEAGPHVLSSSSIRQVAVEDGRFIAEPRVLRDEVLPRGFIAPSSRDGSRSVIVFEQVMDRAMGVELSDLSESSHRAVARSVGSWITAPSISPDGRRVAFFRNDLLGPNPYVAEFDGGVERPLGSREGRLREWATWTPDGERLILHGHPEMPLAVFDFGTGTERELDGIRGCYLGMLADGRLLSVNSVCWQRNAWEPIRLVDPATGSSRDLPDVPGTPRWILVEARGERIWATAGPPGGEDTLYSLEPDGAEWRDHGPFPGARAFDHQLLAVDGEGRIYWMEAGETTRIFRVDPGSDDSELVRELDFECVVGNASVTPDLSRFVCNATESNSDAWLVDRGAGG